jgi:hypothetical protein
MRKILALLLTILLPILLVAQTKMVLPSSSFVSIEAPSAMNLFTAGTSHFIAAEIIGGLARSGSLLQ